MKSRTRTKKFNQYNEFDNLLEGGEEAPAEEPPAEEEKKSEKKSSSKKESSKKESSEKKSEKEESKKTDTPSYWDDDDPYSPPVPEECCCCVCVCANEFTKDLSCCGCFPIKCGAVTIGILTVVLVTIFFVWNFFLFLNEYLHWWYVLVCMFLLCPSLVAASFCISYFTKDSKTTRALLFTSQILIIVSISLLQVWNLVYFVWIYKKDAFYAGMGDIPTNTYTKQSKKTFLFTMLAETVVILVLWSYFLCVVSAYMDACHGPEEEEGAEAEPEAEAEAEPEAEEADDKGAEEGEKAAE